MDVIVRLVAASMALYVIARGSWRLRAVWRFSTSEIRLLWVSVLIFAAATAHGTIEATVLRVPFGPRSFSAFLACAVAALLVSLPQTHRDPVDPA